VRLPQASRKRIEPALVAGDQNQVVSALRETLGVDGPDATRR
jgi:hypothetical protein